MGICCLRLFSLVSIQGRFSEIPSVLLTAKHAALKRKRDAATLWTEDVTKTSFKICIREIQNFDGHHKDISVVRIGYLSRRHPKLSVRLSYVWYRLLRVVPHVTDSFTQSLGCLSLCLGFPQMRTLDKHYRLVCIVTNNQAKVNYLVRPQYVL